MTQEDKELLLKDLCARVPYHPKGHVVNSCNGAQCDEWLTCATFTLFTIATNNSRLYLRHLSSMTKEEKAELKDITNEFGDNWFEATTPEERWKCTFLNSSNQIDWLNSHHFDYRGLIEKGLAIEAPKGMYNIKEK